VTATKLAGEPILARLTRAPGNNAEIGGLKVTTPNDGLPRGPRHGEHLQAVRGKLSGRGPLQAIIAEAQESWPLTGWR